MEYKFTYFFAFIILLNHCLSKVGILAFFLENDY
jgi:hypothetical protein